MERAFLHLKKDQRVIDFCGENLKAGYYIKINSDPTENYIKFDFTLKGGSGKLGTTVIGDYLTQRELNILEMERQDFFNQKQEIKEKLGKVSSSNKPEQE